MNDILKHNLKIEPYPYQQDGIRFGLEHKRIIIGDEPGLGKSESIDSLIATPHGFVRMGDISVGEELFGQNGNIYNVLGVFPQGKLPTYKVYFSDGSSCECSLDHLWNVRDENRRRRGTGWVTKTLKEIVDSGLTLKSNPKREASGRAPILKWEIPMCEPVSYRPSGVIIPPYTMGAFIGDGYMSHTSHVSISLPEDKMFILDKMRREKPIFLDVTQRKYEGIYHIDFVNSREVSDPYHTQNAYMQEIRRLKLNVVSGEKFIPKLYLQGSEWQRKEFLAGLMDTDGSCIKNRTVFHTTSEQLARDVRELVQSLGGIAIIHRYDRTEEGKAPEYQVNIRTTFCPFSDECYKAASWRPNNRFKVTRYIKSVEYIGEKECQCIKTSAPDELYLTDEYIVTHNTLQSIGIVDTAGAYPCLVICPSSLKINWQREFGKFTDKSAIVLDNTVRTTWPYLLKMGMHQVAIVNYESLRKYFVWDIKAGKQFRLKDDEERRRQ